MAIQKFTRAVQTAYVEALKNTGPSIDSVVFPSRDISAAAEVELDQFLRGAMTMRVSAAGAPSNVRRYEGGQRLSIIPPLHSEKLIIDQALRDSAIAGRRAEDVAATIEARRNQIINGPAGFVAAWLMARNIAVCNLLRTGKAVFYDGASEEELVYDFERSATNSQTYSFKTANASFDEALRKMYVAGRAAYMPANNFAVILGADWLARFDRDAAVQKKRAATQSLALISESLVPPRLKRVEGLTIVARYHVDGLSLPVWILAYEPPQLLKKSQNSAPEPYVPDNAALFFSLDSGGYRFFRGVDVLDGTGNVQRVQQGLAIDSYTENDPIAEVLRAQSRFFYIPANINHTGCCVGSGF